MVVTLIGLYLSFVVGSIVGAIVALVAREVVAIQKKQKPAVAGENVILGSFSAKLVSVAIDKVNGESIVFLKLCVLTSVVDSLYGGASIVRAEEVAVALFAKKDGDA